MPPVPAWFHPTILLFGLALVAGVLVWRRWGLQRAMQVLSSGLFVCLLWLASHEHRPTWPVDLYLFSDPLVALIHTVAGRVVVGLLCVAVVVVALTAVLGRVFCSHFCPLGVLLDLTDRWLARASSANENWRRLRRMRKVKFAVLLVVCGAASLGVNLLGYTDPVVWLTRSSAMVLHPVLLTLAGLGVAALRPLGAWLGWLELAYLDVPSRVFAGGLGMAALLAALLLLSRLQRRFWCRHLCPLGALLAWASKWAPYRRRVTSACDGCSRCAARCPVGAIEPSTACSDRSECIVCLACVRACPQRAISFGFSDQSPAAERAGVVLSRRAFVGTAVGGVAVGFGVRVAQAGLAVNPPLRPPGAIVEAEFVARCIRCGECLRACVTNALQPDWHRAGPDGFWAPHLDFERGACQQECNACGQVCPTRAIRPLELAEKRYARIGTARVDRGRCRPWSAGEACEVCQAQCPYDAIALRAVAGQGPRVPEVDSSRCNGCGRCEHACPVDEPPGIVVGREGEIRLSSGSYRAVCCERGLVFEKRQVGPAPFRFDGDRLPEGLR